MELDMIDLTDFTFNIPIKIESTDRRNNAITFFEYMNSICKTNYIICENDIINKINILNSPNIKLKLINEPIFHRTKFLNIMAKESNTKFIVNCDIDCLVHEEQLYNSAQALRTNQTDGCNPFNMCTQNIKKNFHNIIKGDRSLRNIIPQQHCYCENNFIVALGGIVMWNKEKFIEIGMENENFISWGPEDWERVHRATKLGARFVKIPGPLYHLEHSKTSNSNEKNPHFHHNNMEFEKIKGMSKEQLQVYIKTWNWVNN
jgi:predicted glycosyltransferase involved in capsule biosynthesis